MGRGRQPQLPATGADQGTPRLAQRPEVLLRQPLARRRVRRLHPVRGNGSLDRRWVHHGCVPTSGVPRAAVRKWVRLGRWQLGLPARGVPAGSGRHPLHLGRSDGSGPGRPPPGRRPGERGRPQPRRLPRRGRRALWHAHPARRADPRADGATGRPRCERVLRRARAGQPHCLRDRRRTSAQALLERLRRPLGAGRPGGRQVVKEGDLGLDNANWATWSPDGRHVAATGFDGGVDIIDTETGQLVREPIEAHGDNAVWAVFSDDGARVVSGAVDGSVILWDAATGNITGRVAGPTGISLSWASGATSPTVPAQRRHHDRAVEKGPRRLHLGSLREAGRRVRLPRGGSRPHRGRVGRALPRPTVPFGVPPELNGRPGRSRPILR